MKVRFKIFAFFIYYIWLLRLERPHSPTKATSGIVKCCSRAGLVNVLVSVLSFFLGCDVSIFSNKQQ